MLFVWQMGWFGCSSPFTESSMDQCLQMLMKIFLKSVVDRTTVPSDTRGPRFESAILSFIYSMFYPLRRNDENKYKGAWKGL